MEFVGSLLSFIKKTILFLSCLAFTFVLIIILIILMIYKGVTENKFILKNETPVTIENKIIQNKIYLFADAENDVTALSKAVKIVNNDSFSNIKKHVVLLGDESSFGVKSDLQNIKKELEGLSITYSVIPGDRDLWKTKSLENYSAVFGKSYYTKELNGLKLLFIDNSDEYAGISNEQFAFIKQNISDSDFVFLHNPIFFGGTFFKKIFRKGMGQYSGEVDAQRIELLKLIRNSSVRAVFAGDQHVYSESTDDVKSDLTHYVIGALNNERSVGGSSYAILTVYEDGSYKVENIALAN